MRFMVMIKASSASEAGTPPSPELVAAMGQLAEEMTRSGVMLSSEGLLPSSAGTRIGYAAGKRTLIDGPFAEAKELIGGFAIIRASSKEEAVALSDRVVQIHIDAGIRELEMEIRPLFDAGCSEPPKR
jgi:hypothetical protein